ncbi:MAG: acyl-ACP--UDP-N-acetylglucosamine O-acyltransferase [Bauldia litoralis]
MAEIHPTAIVADGARLGANVSIGPFSIIGADVVLEDDVAVHGHALVDGHTTIGARTTVYSYAAIGGPPQDTSYRGEPTEVIIGTDCIIREQVTIHRGTARGRGKTVVGNKCFLMIGCHVAHDCVVGNEVVMVNSATLGGHTEIGEHAILGGLSAIQQHCRIGAHAFIGGLSGITTDVIPFVSAIGDRAEIGGLNIVGLKRRGFDRPTIHALRAAYKAVFEGGGTREDRVARVADAYADVPAVLMIVDFIRAGGDRPLCMPRD